jgi:hypothetical protein
MRLGGGSGKGSDGECGRAEQGFDGHGGFLINVV